MYADRVSYYWTRNAFVYNRAEDKFKWDLEPYTLTGGYPRTNLPYYGTLQVAVKLYQEDYSEVSDDTVIIYKIPFMITSRPKRPQFYFLLVGIVILVMSVAAFVVLRFTKRAVEQKIKNNREDVRYTSASSFELGGQSTGLELN